MRGDRPQQGSIMTTLPVFTPHARGSTQVGWEFQVWNGVYPACAGIDLVRIRSIVVTLSLPRMRGDRPQTQFDILELEPFTPHARGSTPKRSCTEMTGRVYPACAGIDLDVLKSKIIAAGLPRMRGDRPVGRLLELFFQWFTPHARGSTEIGDYYIDRLMVYPACAGIDRVCKAFCIALSCLPRMRGDRPHLDVRLDPAN